MEREQRQTELRNLVMNCNDIAENSSLTPIEKITKSNQLIIETECYLFPNAISVAKKKKAPVVDEDDKEY